jgi:hypothetical protein
MKLGFDNNRLRGLIIGRACLFASLSSLSWSLLPCRFEYWVTLSLSDHAKRAAAIFPPLKAVLAVTHDDEGTSALVERGQGTLP